MTYVFAGVINRDEGSPWGTSGMSSMTWLSVPAELVPLRALIMTQPGILFSALLSPGLPVGGDLLPHVIDWQGALYLEDGHHRAVRAALAGEDSILARVLRLHQTVL